jgi:hypothetical protein
MPRNPTAQSHNCHPPTVVSVIIHNHSHPCSCPFAASIAELYWRRRYAFRFRISDLRHFSSKCSTICDALLVTCLAAVTCGRLNFHPMHRTFFFFHSPSSNHDLHHQRPAFSTAPPLTHVRAKTSCPARYLDPACMHFIDLPFRLRPEQLEFSYASSPYGIFGPGVPASSSAASGERAHLRDAGGRCTAWRFCVLPHLTAI